MPPRVAAQPYAGGIPSGPGACRWALVGQPLLAKCDACRKRYLAVTDARTGHRRRSICGRPLPGKGKRSDRCCAWSDAVICPAFDAAGRQPPACMGVRGPGPNHPKRARSTVESPGCPSPVSPTVAPYSPSAHPYVFAIVVSLRRRGRSSIGAAFDQQGPDDAGQASRDFAAPAARTRSAGACARARSTISAASESEGGLVAGCRPGGLGKTGR